jgi:hypothetical protein
MYLKGKTMMNQKAVGLAMGLLVTLTAGRLMAGDEFEFQQIKFFEGPRQAQAKDARVYDTHFLKGSVRFIWTEVTVRNLRYQDYAHSHSIVVKYYRPDGSLEGEVKSDFTIRPEWYTAYKPCGWGADNGGTFPIGTYRVVVFMDGEKVGEDKFSIAASDDYDVDSIRLFEGGYDAPAKEARVYRTSFEKSSTRYIWTELNIKNRRYQQYEHTHNITLKYYNPDGSLRGQTDHSYTVKSEWLTSWKASGWGWKTAGNWPAGTYRVVVEMDGTVVGEKAFTVEGDEEKFPEPEQVERTNDSAVAWEIVNDTDSTITITYSGSLSGTITVEPKGSTIMNLNAGAYSVRGTCSKPGVLPYSGSVNFSEGWKYRNTFFIQYQ